MGLKTIFKKAAKTAFAVAGDVKISVTFRNVTDNGFEDPVTTDTVIEVIRMEFEAEDYRELNFKELIQAYDFKLIALYDDMNSVDMNDKVFIDTVEYSIIGVDKDAADATWTIGIR